MNQVAEEFRDALTSLVVEYREKRGLPAEDAYALLACVAMAVAEVDRLPTEERFCVVEEVLGLR